VKGQKRMIKKFKMTLTGLAMAVAVVGANLAAVQPVAAQLGPLLPANGPEAQACEGSGGTWTGNSCTNPNSTRTVAGTLKNVGNILIFLTGAISVLMIIIGGFRYVLSGGDQGGITSAKNTILYAIVGLIVSVAAYAIVNFVLRNI